MIEELHEIEKGYINSLNRRYQYNKILYLDNTLGVDDLLFIKSEIETCTKAIDGCLKDYENIFVSEVTKLSDKEGQLVPAVINSVLSDLNSSREFLIKKIFNGYNSVIPFYRINIQRINAFITNKDINSIEDTQHIQDDVQGATNLLAYVGSLSSILLAALFPPAAVPIAAGAVVCGSSFPFVANLIKYLLNKHADMDKNTIYIKICVFF